MRRGRGPRRFPHCTVLVLAVLAAVFGFSGAVHPAAAHPAAAHAARPDAARSAAGPGRPVAAVTLADRQPAAPGGACSVPGIGDIGSLLGFCTLGQSGLTGDLNNICQPSLPDPEPANSGIDAMVRPPASSGQQPATLYGSYGVAGQFWASTNLQCSDMTSLIGDNVASMVFDIAKSIDRVTITVYQSAAGEGILSWLTGVVDKLISSLGNAIYFPYLAAVVIIGAIWLAWQGLIRRRGTRTIEGTIWMVVACAAAIWLIGRPADFTGMGTAVSDGVSQTLNTAFAKLPAPSQSNCLPVSRNDPQVQPANFNFSSGNGIVAENANELWTVLVCKPWLAGEFGTTAFSTSANAQTPVNTYGRQLLWAQAFATNETQSNALLQAKQATYSGIASSIQQKDPAIYPLFQGKQWTTRLEIALAALFAAAIAGVLVLLIAVTLILLKLGFLLLLVAGPFFLLIGTHPGFGRVVALRWFEMLVGVLLKMAAISLVLSVLLYAYTLIMGTSDAVLPWALKILMIALVTVAVFIYRRPFQHLFSAVGYGMIGATERAEVDLERGRATLRSNTLGAAAAVVPGTAAYRAARWARRNPAQAAGVAAGAAAAGGVGAAAAAGQQNADGAGLSGEDGALADGSGAAAGIAPPEGGTRAGSRSGLASRARTWAAAAAGDGAGRSAPPLNLPSRENGSPAAGSAAPGRTAAGAAAAVAAGSARAGQARTGAPGTVSGTGSSGTRSPGTGSPGTRSPGTGSSGRVSSGRVSSGTGPPRPGQPGSGSAVPGQAVPGGPRPAPARPASPSPVQAGRVPSGPALARGAASGPPPARQAPSGPPPARQAPSGPAPARGAASGPPPVRQAPARGAPPARQAPSGPAASPAPPRPAGPGSAWWTGAASRPSAAGRPAADPAPRGPSGYGQGGPWADSSAGRPSAPPARQPARPSAAEPARQRAAAPGRPQPGAPAQGDGSAGPPLSGNPDADQAEGSGPFWLRPIRRRK
jgi:TrbL/VirB6 plasmid conjugal transfer protein